MGLTNDWQIKNKRKRGTSKIPIRDGDDSTFDINVGSGNLLEGKGVDKRSRMLSMRNNITVEDKELLYDILKQNSSEMLLFESLRSNGFPLEYLVALGLTTEEDVQTFNIMKQRGIDINNYINTQDDSIDIDSNYISEINIGEKPLPKLKKLDGTIIKEFAGGKGINLTQGITYNEREEYERLKKSELELLDKIAQLEGKSNSSNGNSYVNDFEEEFEDAPNESNDLMDLIGSLGKGGNRTIYILGKDRGLTFSGYNIKYTMDINYIVNKVEDTGDLLIVTRYIKEDSKFLSKFSKWLKKVSKNGSNTLIVSEKGSNIRSSAIQGELNIDKESLDNYFNTTER